MAMTNIWQWTYQCRVQLTGKCIAVPQTRKHFIIILAYFFLTDIVLLWSGLFCPFLSIQSVR